MRSPITVEGRLAALRQVIEDNALDGLDQACRWLAENRPEAERLAICHSDMQPINILVTDGEITGVVDWSQVVIADAALDVGYTKMAFETVPLNMPSFLQWIARPVTGIVSRRYLKNYTERRSLTPAAVAYYGALRAVFALAGLGARRLGGSREPDVWDNPQGVRNLTARVRSATGIEIQMPEDTRAGRAESSA